jgi:hypothetical protein
LVGRNRAIAGSPHPVEISGIENVRSIAVYLQGMNEAGTAVAE